VFPQHTPKLFQKLYPPNNTKGSLVPSSNYSREMASISFGKTWSKLTEGLFSHNIPPNSSKNFIPKQKNNDLPLSDKPLFFIFLHSGR
ncbi:MAG: hypothetical protein J6D00_03835, partial [Christensenellaceae bacterium]|nr:hypothetical protein [Christensenellaceae bacterium]